MTCTASNNGRLGNQIIRNLAVSFIAEKFDLKVDYANKELIEKLGIPLFSGTIVHNNTIDLTEDNYFNVYNDCHSNLHANHNFFQTNEISNFIFDYLQSIKSNIIEKNSYKNRYNNNNDLFIHVRLDDVAKYNPGIDYYLNVIKTLSFDTIYLSTDEKDHPIIKEIEKNYPIQLIEYDEITTFQFASTCKHILLSHGSFSAIIGYLSFFSDVYYSEYSKIWYGGEKWHGDMFRIKNWTKCNFNE